jgi:hypothetical protein
VNIIMTSCTGLQGVLMPFLNRCIRDALDSVGRMTLRTPPLQTVNTVLIVLELFFSVARYAGNGCGVLSMGEIIRVILLVASHTLKIRMDGGGKGCFVHVERDLNASPLHREVAVSVTFKALRSRLREDDGGARNKQEDCNC